MSSPWDQQSARGRSDVQTNEATDERPALRRRRGATEDEDSRKNALESPDVEATHPLTPNYSRSTSPFNGLDIAEASRPSLRRLTSEVEKEVANASAASRSSIDERSARGSLDLLREAIGKLPGPNEVEVLVHDVKARESLMGIALMYGIDVATLRKVNKLWASDSVHLRRHLYVPLEACKWAQATEGFIRGPGDGQITLVSKAALHDPLNGPSGSTRGITGPPDAKLEKGQGMAKEVVGDLAESFSPLTNAVYGNLVDFEEDGRPSMSRSTSATIRDLVKGTGVLGSGDATDGKAVDGHTHSSMKASTTSDAASHGTILSVIRIPASELAFFPKAKQPPARKSLDTLSPILEPPALLRRSPSSNFPSPLHTSFQPSSGPSGDSTTAGRRPFTTSALTPATWSASMLNSKSRKADPFRSSEVSVRATSNETNQKQRAQAKDRPFEMATRRGDGAKALPMDSTEKAASKKQAGDRTSWFSVADDGIDPARGNGGWG